MERAYVQKDFRRVGIVVAIALLILVVSGIVESAVIK